VTEGDEIEDIFVRKVFANEDEGSRAIPGALLIL
jgi:hypothetical protein